MGRGRWTSEEQAPSCHASHNLNSLGWLREKEFRARACIHVRCSKILHDRCLPKYEIVPRNKKTGDGSALSEKEKVLLRELKENVTDKMSGKAYK